MATQYGAQLYALHVVRKRSIPQDVLEFVEAEEIEAPAESVFLDRLGEKIVQSCELLAKPHCDDLKTIVVHGDPAEVILEIAKEKEADVIVLGSRGLGKVRGALLGSVSRKVTSLSDRTCIVVK